MMNRTTAENHPDRSSHIANKAALAVSILNIGNSRRNHLTSKIADLALNKCVSYTTRIADSGQL